MKNSALETRTRRFALDVIAVLPALKSEAARMVLSRQLLRSATSIGANYREANHSISRRDFAHKISITEKEAAETLYWLELLLETDTAAIGSLAPLAKEADELTRIFTAISRTLKETMGKREEGA